ncbi:MAG: hypothetical protein ACLPSW_20250 [Roseiarcus sp.]
MAISIERAETTALDFFFDPSVKAFGYAGPSSPPEAGQARPLRGGGESNRVASSSKV